MSGAVLCRRVPDYEQGAVDAAVEEIFAASAAAAGLGADSRVVIKPNLLAKHVPEHAVTTHPAVVKACISALRRRGVRHITVADSPGGVYTPAVMKSVYKTSGLAAVCAETGAEPYTECKYVEVKSGGALVPAFNVLEPLARADLIVDCPKVKPHVMTGLSCAVKNMFGAVPGLQKAELHMRFPDKAHFGRMLADLWRCLSPGLVVADGVLAMEGDGPAGGQPRKLGVILGGEDGFAVDLALCRLMGFAPEQVPYLAAAIEAGECPADFDPALLCGDADDRAPLADWRRPASFAGVDFSASVPRPIRWLVPGAEKLVAPRPRIDRKKCVGCGKCAEICPGHTIRVQDGKARIEPAGCIRCFCCHEMCPVKAIDVKRFFVFHL